MFLEDKKRIFQNDLLEMKVNGFIDEETYSNLHKASDEFYNKKSELLKSREVDEKKFSYKTNQTNKQPMERKITSRKRDVLSEQQIAERKASILLNLGVVFLFLSGLIFATTNWDNLGLVGKILSVTFMGSILYAGSHVAETKLKLEKTALALWVLTTLYIPVVGITFMYSFMWNNGVKIDSPMSLVALGLIGVVSTLVNIISFKKYENKYYMWASYITAELSILFFNSSLKIGMGETALVAVLYSCIVLYTYLKLTREDYRKYTRQYLMILNQATLWIALIFGPNELSKVPYTIAVILLIALSIYSSYKLKDKFIGIAITLFLPLKTFGYAETLNLDPAVCLIPGVLLLGIQYLSLKEKLHSLVGYIAIGVSFILFNIVLFSNTLLYTIGVSGIIVSALMLSKSIKLPVFKFMNLNKFHYIVIPIYTYVLIGRLPFILFNMTYVQEEIALTLSAIILCFFQYVISPKYRGMKLAYSEISIIILLINSFNGSGNEYLLISLFMALDIFEVVGLSKRLNKVAYIVNIFLGITILATTLKYNSNTVTIAILLGVVITMLTVAKINKEHRRYILLCISIFMAIAVNIGNESLITLVIIITSVILGAISLKSDESNGLLVLSLTVAYGILLQLENVTGDDFIIILLESLYAVILSTLGAIYYKKIRKAKKYDSLTISAIIIIALLNFTIANSYTGLIITTISALGIVGLNYKKLSSSVILKSFIVLKLISAYIQVIILSKISMGDGILIIPILVWASSSRYYIFKNNKFGYVSERISLLSLVLKLISNVMNFDTISAMVVITIGIGVLVISYTKKIKAYFITSIFMIVLPLIKGSLDFWALIPWWTYLLIVGIVLLIMGSMAEKNKNKSFKELRNRIFKDWK